MANLETLFGSLAIFGLGAMVFVMLLMIVAEVYVKNTDDKILSFLLKLSFAATLISFFLWLVALIVNWGLGVLE